MDELVYQLSVAMEVVRGTEELLNQETMTSLLWQLGQIGLVLIAAFLIERLGVRAINKVFEPREGGELLSQELSKTLRLSSTTLLRYVLVLLVILAILQIFDIRVIGPEQVRQVGVGLIKVIGIIVLAQVALSFGAAFIDHLFKSSQQYEGLFEEKRSKTLQGLLKSVLRYGVYFVAGVMILDNFGVPTSSILAGAGIIGLAVGFGAQNLVRDVITGFFIILEDQYSVGDFVTLGGVTGTVQDLGLRTTRIKEWTGQLHVIPNGEVTRVTNFSKNKMASVVAISIAYEEDIDKAMEVLREAGLNAREALPQIIEDPIVQGVVELGDSEVVLRVIAYTAPGEQWAVERELRKRFKQALDAANIEIPYPRRVVISKNG